MSESPRVSWRLIGLGQCHRSGLVGELPIVVCRSFGRWNIADELQQTVVVEPGHTFEGALPSASPAECRQWAVQPPAADFR